MPHPCGLDRHACPICQGITVSQMLQAVERGPAGRYLIRPVLMAQALTQIRDYYGSNESITGLCAVRVFFPTADESTQTLASHTCGTSTQWAESTGVGHTGKQTISSHEVQRPVLYPHELAAMKAAGQIVVYKKGVAPIKGRPADI
jgi:type IV secretory pathway TraG/TraD family ATPase VirD4